MSTPSQTVGPFYGYALPFAKGGEIAPAGDPRTITVHGVVRDGNGSPVPDALLEFWQSAPDGSRTGAPGSLRRDPADGAVLGRDGVAFTGFGRVATDADGRYAVRTLPPPADAPYLAVVLFARGLLHHLHTRAYLADQEGDALLAALPEDRRATLIARQEREGVYGFDIRIQGRAAEETVFLEFHRPRG
ncbi:protocatechuate 3,4-dioxygenase subunit alpha [Actinacidiphila bryophytorum]|uniref:Protocatechuate 3,4-dioxygenase alpha chain n=1 Tax=Actinacidiphila bryophytorum TaxID=1436133 RepID=A0A9W4E4Z8_9ACTN|nr:protocatechuate 3,4-dioxygenase subunit alpha [Actinacidiphila bryophytorum]CAG7612966.1 Protocatechuate 3,4-dioxygenase alpha chain [Actinacidiphila bryophytorum]